MSEPPVISVVLIDDHEVLREGLAIVLALEPDIRIAGQAGSGPEGIEVCQRVRPDVVLLDLRMPGTGGMEVLPELRVRFPDTRVLILTSHDGDEAVHRALAAGAAGYLLKSARRAELAAAIRQAMTGKVLPNPAIAHRLAQHERYEALTSREAEVLAHIALGEANKDIAEALGISHSTVKNHMKKILLKLGASDRTEALTIGLQRGIVDLSR